MAINRLYLAYARGQPVSGTRVVYVSPLKALAVDIAENLERPLAEISAKARRLGLADAVGRFAHRRHHRQRTGGDGPEPTHLRRHHARVALPPRHRERYALEGLGQLLSNIELVRAHLNPTLHVSTILLTMYDGRTKLADQVTSEVRSHFGETVLRTVIPRSVKVSEAPGFGQTVLSYDPGSRGSMSYIDAAREIAERGAALSEDGR